METVKCKRQVASIKKTFPTLIWTSPWRAAGTLLSRSRNWWPSRGCVTCNKFLRLHPGEMFKTNQRNGGITVTTNEEMPLSKFMFASILFLMRSLHPMCAQIPPANINFNFNFSFHTYLHDAHKISPEWIIYAGLFARNYLREFHEIWYQRQRCWVRFSSRLTVFWDNDVV